MKSKQLAFTFKMKNVHPMQPGEAVEVVIRFLKSL